MPALSQSGGGPSQGRRGFTYRSLPPWLQWALPFAVAGVVVVAVVMFVRYETDDVPQIAKVTSPAAIAEQNREAAILVREQQAPHTARLSPGQSPDAGARAAVVRYMNLQISRGSMAGPIERASCRSLPGTTGARLLVRCTVDAANVRYPFEAVVRPAAEVVIYCQRVLPPVPSMNVALSGRCT